MAKVNLGSMQQQNAVEAFNKLEKFAGKVDDNAKIRATKEKGIYGSTSGGTFFRHWKKGARVGKRNELHTQLQQIGNKCFGKDPLMKAAWEATIGRANLSNQHDLTGKDFKQIVSDMKNALNLAHPEVTEPKPQQQMQTQSKQTQVQQLPQMTEEEEDALIDKMLGNAGSSDEATFEDRTRDAHFHDGKVPIIEDGTIDPDSLKQYELQTGRRARTDSMETHFPKEEQ